MVEEECSNDKKKSIAIVKSDQDLLRIIPSKKSDSNAVEFKITTYNDHDIYYWHLGSNPVIPEKQKLNAGAEEITYHSSKFDGVNFKNAAIHIKKREVHPGEERFSFTHKISDADINTEFPIPLFKLGINLNEEKKMYKRKKKHFVFDIDNNDRKDLNVVEVYFASASFDRQAYMDKWAIQDALMTISSMDYVVKGANQSIEIYKSMSNGGMLMLHPHKFGDFQLFFKTYYDENVTGNSICFYENKAYIDMLATTMVSFKRENGITTKPVPAYRIDLDYQRSQGLHKVRFDNWIKLFKRAEKNMSALNLNRPIVVLPSVRK